MKQKSIFLLLITLFSINFLSAQYQVKIKKGKVLINNEHYVNIEVKYGKNMVSTKGGTEFATLTQESFNKPNPAHYNTHDPNRHKYPATTKTTYFVVKFLGTEIEFEAQLSRKKIMEAFYENEVLDNGETLNPENAKLVADKVGSNISGNRPGEVIHY